MLLFFGSAVVSAAALQQLELLRWTATGAELEALSSQPQVCMFYPLPEEANVLAGQALFNSPALLGGQAAKAGLNCASCHVNGRGNTHFFMRGVSDQPGTADVTSSFFSAARGNGKFDPVVIPDLAKPGKIPRDSEALETFIRNLIVNEFGGNEPQSATLKILAAYVRGINGCAYVDEDKVTNPRKLSDQLFMLKGALTGAENMADTGDWVSTELLLAAARHQLALISERYTGSRFKRQRSLLLNKSRSLARLMVHRGSPEDFGKAVADWKLRFDDDVADILRQTEQQSLYNPANFKIAAAGNTR